MHSLHGTASPAIGHQYGVVMGSLFGAPEFFRIFAEDLDLIK